MEDGGIQYHQQLGQQEHMMSEQSSFVKLAALDVSKHVEKKQNLSYLSWAWAWDQLMRQDPTASVEYHEPVKFGGETMMVSCTVTAFGIPRRMHLPVMDYKNKAISNPDAFAVNTAMQRCLVKAIALHGLGLYIYAGEDLPESPVMNKPQGTITPSTGVWESMDEGQQKALEDIAANVSALISEDRVGDALDYISKQALNSDERVALNTRFDSKQRSAMKKEGEKRKNNPAPTPEDYINTP